MPYIEAIDRNIVDELIDKLAACVETEGDANYVISRFCHRLFQVPVNETGAVLKLNYTNLNNLVGVLECVKQEFYRTVVAPYEDKKKALNGPVSSLDA